MINDQEPSQDIPWQPQFGGPSVQHAGEMPHRSTSDIAEALRQNQLDANRSTVPPKTVPGKGKSRTYGNSIGFEYVDFNIIRNKGVSSIEIEEEERQDERRKIAKALGPKNETSGHIEMVRISKSGYLTFMLKDEQMIQLVPNKQNPDVIDTVRFYNNNIIREQAQIALEAMEKEGKFVDIEKLKITGAPEGIRNARAAFREEQGRRVDVVMTSFHNWQTDQLRRYPKSDEDCPEAVEIRRDVANKIKILDVIATASAEGRLSNKEISEIYNTMTPRGHNPVERAHTAPNWERLAQIAANYPPARNDNNGPTQSRPQHGPNGPGVRPRMSA